MEEEPPHVDAIRRTPTYSAGLPDTIDPTDLPSRILRETATLEEYTRETPEGRITKPVRSHATGKIEDFELVTFKLDDPENPKNWSKARKWYITMVVAVTCFVVAFDSSVITAGINQVAEEFAVGEVVALLTITVFVIGFGIGPMVFAPMSEMIGRKPVYTSTLLVAVVFLIPCAVAQNFATLVVCRAIAGVAFSAPMTLVGGTLADMWRNEERGVPMAAFSAAPFIGPAAGPLIGGFLSDAKGWRWLYWLQLILSGAAWVLLTFTVPETYTPTLLAMRAKRLREETKNKRYVTEEDLDSRPLGEKLRLFLFRPFQLLFLEPIVLLFSIYMSILYGLLYMFFIAFPIVYHGGKGYSASVTGLMFIPLSIGVFASACFSPLVNKHYLKLSARYSGRPPAEIRLVPMMMSCWFIPIGMFIFAWTSYPQMHWIGPTLGGLPVGFGFIFLYNSCNNYLVDTYQHQAASALAAKTFLRSMWGASVVLFTRQMYDKLGYQWASSLIAFLGLACCAIPFCFYYKGDAIRRHSKYAFVDDAEQEILGK
ncbi:multidrug resistant protein [Histoplasma capsulatum G186AR]|uniref:Multidrug resistant protein n=1 Tax=Ajellomyces capsulatus (strain G186AR / H82 / ATCC MYA-2454 / RMSCC 2432) TaxID=447093 RepID=C0NTE0_AJECG|nr:multidrug resistant protein [Histoplasma capsulatum G186AR]EEH05301.1 multidrug resistant protein [Histoplasma capsulatum G186AR]